MEFSTEILWKSLWKSAKLCGKPVDMWKTAFHPRAACLTRKEVTRTNERIKKLRKALDLTQAEFASRIGTTQNSLAGYETGRRNSSSSVVNNICKEFRVNETWLRTGEGDMFLPSPNGVLDELVQKYGLSTRGKVIVEKFLDLNPDVQEAVAVYIEEVAAAFSDDGTTATVPVFAPAHIPTIEDEARAEANQQAQLIYQQILSEKKAAAGMLPESSGPLAGGGTAKQA